MNALWLAVPYLLGGLAVAAWRWFADHDVRKAMIESIVARNLARPSWRDQLARAVGRKIDLHRRARIWVRTFYAFMIGTWPLILLAEGVFWVLARWRSRR